MIEQQKTKRVYIKKIIKANKTADRCKYQREYLKVRPEKRREYQANYYTKLLARLTGTKTSESQL